MPVRAPRKKKSTQEVASSSQGNAVKKLPSRTDKEEAEVRSNYKATKLDFEVTKTKNDSGLHLKKSQDLGRDSGNPDRQKSQPSLGLLSRVKTTRTKSLPFPSSSKENASGTGGLSKTDDNLKQKRGGNLKSFASRELLSKVKLPSISSISVNNADRMNREVKEATGAEAVTVIADNAEKVKGSKDRINVNGNLEAPSLIQKRKLSIIDSAFFADTSPSPPYVPSTMARHHHSYVTKPSSVITAVSRTLPRKYLRDKTAQSQGQVCEFDELTIENSGYKSSPNKTSKSFYPDDNRNHSIKIKSIRPTKSLNLFFVHGKQTERKNSEKKDIMYNSSSNSAAVEVHVIPAPSPTENSLNGSSTSSSTCTLSSYPALNSTCLETGKMDQCPSFVRSKTMPGWASKLFNRMK